MQLIPLRSRRLSVVFCLFLLIGSACSSRRISEPRLNSAKNLYRSVKPSELSNYVRSVIRISEANSESALESLRLFHEENPELAELAEQLTHHADNRESRRFLAAEYLKAGLYLEAYRLFMELQNRFEDHDPQVHFGLAEIWYAWRDYPLARHSAEQAIRAGLEDGDVYDLLGRIHLGRRDPVTAIQAFQLVLTRNPEDASALANIGYALMLEKNWEQARVFLESALERQVGLREAQNNLGIVLAKLGDTVQALHHFVTAEGPAAGHNNLGVVLLEQGRWQEAERAFQAALKFDPFHEKAARNLAETQSYLPPPTIVDLASFSLERFGRISASSLSPGSPHLTASDSFAIIERRIDPSLSPIPIIGSQATVLTAPAGDPAGSQMPSSPVGSVDLGSSLEQNQPYAGFEARIEPALFSAMATTEEPSGAYPVVLNLEPLESSMQLQLPPHRGSAVSDRLETEVKVQLVQRLAQRLLPELVGLPYAARIQSTEEFERTWREKNGILEKSSLTSSETAPNQERVTAGAPGMVRSSEIAAIGGLWRSDVQPVPADLVFDFEIPVPVQSLDARSHLNVRENNYEGLASSLPGPVSLSVRDDEASRRQDTVDRIPTPLNLLDNDEEISFGSLSVVMVIFGLGLGGSVVSLVRSLQRP